MFAARGIVQAGVGVEIGVFVGVLVCPIARMCGITSTVISANHRMTRRAAIVRTIAYPLMD
jgi:hypothetical protein